MATPPPGRRFNTGRFNGRPRPRHVPPPAGARGRQRAGSDDRLHGESGFILDGIEGMGLELTLTVVLLTMLSFFVLKGVAKFGATYLNVIYQQYFIRKIRVENINALTNYSYNAFVTADAGNIQNTLSGEVERVVQGFRRFSQLLQQSVLLLTYAFLAFLANPEFAIFVVIGGGLSHFLFNTLYKRTKALSTKLVRSNSDFQGLLIQEVAFFKYLKATGSIRTYANNLIQKVYEIEDRVRKMGVLNAIMQGAREPIMIGIVVLVILAQVKLMGGQLSSIIMSLLFFYRGLTALMQVYKPAIMASSPFPAPSIICAPLWETCNSTKKSKATTHKKKSADGCNCKPSIFPICPRRPSYKISIWTFALKKPWLWSGRAVPASPPS